MTAGDIIGLGLLSSFLAGVGTSFGAAGVALIRRLSPMLEDILLSVAAGIMLAASFFALLLPGLEYGRLQYSSDLVGVVVVITGLFLGAAALSTVHRLVPHEHFQAGREGPDPGNLARIWLFVIAITLHNFPEGMAVGTGFAGGDIPNGLTLATGIFIQNIPEGLAVAVSLLSIGYSRLKAFGIASLTGLVEPVGGLFGAAAVSLAVWMMPLTLGFSAGAMLFIISDEIIPETHRGGFEHIATFSLLAGFAIMMFIDAVVG